MDSVLPSLPVEGSAGKQQEVLTVLQARLADGQVTTINQDSKGTGQKDSPLPSGRKGQWIARVRHRLGHCWQPHGTRSVAGCCLSVSKAGH